MGDPRKQHKQFTRPKTLFDKSRIDEEKALLEKYGLKNKKEIWRSESYIGRIRNQAKKLILYPEQQEAFINRLVKLGLIKSDATIDDILALTKEKLLERRLQNIVFKKGLAKTPKEARQLVVHRKIQIRNNIVNIPSYIVKTKEEGLILKVKEKEKNKENPAEKIEKEEEQKQEEIEKIEKEEEKENK